MPAKKPDLTPWLWGAAITALLLLPLPTDGAARRWPELVRDLTDFGHPLAFAWFAHVLYCSLRARRPGPSLAPYIWTLAGVAMYGATTELVQTFVARQPSISDFRNDMLGAAISLLLHGRKEWAAAGARAGGVMLAAIAAGVASFPLALTLTAYVHRYVKAPLLWAPESRLFTHFSGWDTEPYPALKLYEPLADWRGHGFLEIDIENTQPQSHPVIVRVHDLWHDLRHRDRFNREFELAPLTRQTLRIPLEEIRSAPDHRQMDMQAISGVIVFSQTPAPLGEFRVHRIQLTP